MKTLLALSLLFTTLLQAKTDHNKTIDYFITGTEHATNKNYFMAKKLYTQGCKEKDANSCYGLAILHWNGKGVRLNKSIAKELAGKGCDLGSKEACEMYAAIQKGAAY